MYATYIRRPDRTINLLDNIGFIFKLAIITEEYIGLCGITCKLTGI